MLEEEIVPQVRTWVVSLLKNKSDADPEILADYVLALLRYDQPKRELEMLCREQLKDFLHNNTDSFVRDVFIGLDRKAYLQQSLAQRRIGYNDRGNSRAVGGRSHTGEPFSNRGAHGGYGGRSELSTSRFTTDLKTIIIENVPADKYPSPIPENFFKEFGKIKNIIRHPLAPNGLGVLEIEFDTHKEAYAAWVSPKPIFDSRFIRVFWRKGDDPVGYQPGDEDFVDPNEIDEHGVIMDKEAFLKAQEERQRSFLEKYNLRRAAEQKRLKFEHERDQILKKHEEAKKILLDRIKNKERELSASIAKDATSSDGANSSSSTTTLIAQELENLKAEASKLGAPALGLLNRPAHRINTRAGRPIYNSYSPYSYPSNYAPISRYNLDLRNTNVSIENVQESRIPEIKAYLAAIGEINSFKRDPANQNNCIVQFKDRITAEYFFDEGKLELNGEKYILAWYEDPNIKPRASAVSTSSNSDVTMED